MMLTALRSGLRRVHREESGHTAPLVSFLLGAAGAIVLTIGAVADQDVVTIIGGVLVALGFLAIGIWAHIQVQYPTLRAPGPA